MHGGATLFPVGTDLPSVHVVSSLADDGIGHLFGNGRIIRGFDLPEEPWDLGDRHWLRAGVVNDPVSAQQAMRALTRGVGLVIVLELEGDRAARFRDDLGKVANVVGSSGSVNGLSSEHETLLDALVSGRSVSQAAQDAYLSRRSAYRRITEAREALGVDTTAALIVRWAEIRATDQSGD